jgi:hypothetical protein
MLIHLRLRAKWNATLPACIVFRPVSGKLNIIVSFVHDVILLLAMLVGLLRIRGQSVGTFEMRRFLWKQVE